MRTGVPRRLITIGLASALAAACAADQTTPPSEAAGSSDLGDPNGLFADLADADDTAEAVELGRDQDRRLAEHTRLAGGLADALGADAATILADADAAREDLLDAAEADDEVAMAGDGAPAALAGLAATFMTTLSPSGLAGRVLAWERNQGGELPDEEVAAEATEGPAALVSLKRMGVVDGVLTVGAEMTLTLDLPDPPGGTLVEVYTGEVEVHVCPDGSGQVPATLELKMTAAADVPGGTVSGETTISTSATGSVDDEAALTSIDFEIGARSRTTSQPDEGQAEGAYGEVEASVTWSPSRGDSPAQASASSGRIVHQSSRATDEDIQSLFNAALIQSVWIVGDSLGEAEELWRGGYCVGVRVTEPEGREKAGIEPESTHAIVAEAIHRREGGTLDAPIEAQMLSGATSVDPSGQRLDSPATFTYVAPPERDQAGRVLLRTVSRRGIGEAEAYFNTFRGYRLRLTNEYEVTFELGPGATSSGSGTDVFEGDLNADTLDGVFETSSEGSSVTQVGDITCTKEWVGTQRLRVDGSPTMLEGRPHVLLVFTPESPPSYTVQEAGGGEFCPFDERTSASGDPILPFNDSFIPDQIPLPIPGPPGEGDPTEYDIPIAGSLDGVFVLAGWHVEWLEPDS